MQIVSLMDALNEAADKRKSLKSRFAAKAKGASASKPMTPDATKRKAEADLLAAKRAAAEKLGKLVTPAGKRKATIDAKQKAQLKSAISAAQAKRKAKAAAKAAAATGTTPGPTAKAAADHVPAQLAHCMIALHKKRGKSVRASWNICRWSLTRYGYLKGPYKKNGKIPQATAQTGKGTRRSFQHGMEKKPLGGGVDGTPQAKYAMFKNMFKAIESSVMPKGGVL